MSPIQFGLPWSGLRYRLPSPVSQARYPFLGTPDAARSPPVAAPAGASPSAGAAAASFASGEGAAAAASARERADEEKSAALRLDDGAAEAGATLAAERVRKSSLGAGIVTECSPRRGVRRMLTTRRGERWPRNELATNA